MKTILVVDDNPLSRELIRDALDSRGYHVIEAEDGEKALEQIEAHAPDLVIMDIQMPVMDGYTAINHIRSDPRLVDLPVLALTAYAMLGDREKAIAAGFRGYMSKPINVTTLRTQIDALLR